ncbi:MAG TPA: EamA family transporter [Polyangiaceae bacterium]
MSKNPVARSSLVAVLAAFLFGATTPIVHYFGADVGPFATATLLYAGAAAGAAFRRRRVSEAPLTVRDVPRLLLVAAFGALLAPVAFAWGLQRTGGLATSLLLNLEAAFTVFLAFVFYREPVGKRVLSACALMMAGGVVLSLRLGQGGAWSALGMGAVLVATLGWALDNTLTRPLADLDARAVVFWKASVGAALSAAAALMAGDAWPGTVALFALLASGAAGYGLSLRLYLQAQRTLGAARTGSLFAVAPFIGAALAFVLGDRSGLALVVGATVLFALAVYLHATEVHDHRHVHEPVEHEHAHVHDDGHHTHRHDPPFTGSHSHRHTHERLEHDHPHGVDVHHRHGHD